MNTNKPSSYLGPNGSENTYYAGTSTGTNQPAEPTSGDKLTGKQANQTLTAAFFNWALQLIDKWIHHLNERTGLQHYDGGEHRSITVTPASSGQIKVAVTAHAGDSTTATHLRVLKKDNTTPALEVREDASRVTNLRAINISTEEWSNRELNLIAYSPADAGPGRIVLKTAGPGRGGLPGQLIAQGDWIVATDDQSQGGTCYADRFIGTIKGNETTGQVLINPTTSASARCETRIRNPNGTCKLVVEGPTYRHGELPTTLALELRPALDSLPWKLEDEGWGFMNASDSTVRSAFADMKVTPGMIFAGAIVDCNIPSDPSGSLGIEIYIHDATGRHVLTNASWSIDDSAGTGDLSITLVLEDGGGTDTPHTVLTGTKLVARMYWNNAGDAAKAIRLYQIRANVT